MPNRGSRSRTRRLRAICIARDGSACRICGRPSPAPPAVHHVDHINGDTSADRDANLRLLCVFCNGLLGSIKQHHPEDYRRIRSSDDKVRAYFARGGGPPQNREYFSGAEGGLAQGNGHLNGAGHDHAWGDIYKRAHTHEGARPEPAEDKRYLDWMVVAFWRAAEGYIGDHGGKAPFKQVCANAGMRVVKDAGVIIKPATQRQYLEWACCDEGPFKLTGEGAVVELRTGGALALWPEHAASAPAGRRNGDRVTTAGRTGKPNG